MKSLDKAYTPIPFDAVSEYLGVFFLEVMGKI
jgi:hypothetical protein